MAASLTAAQLTLFRGLLQAKMPDSGQIWRRFDDHAGGTWAKVGGPVQCRVRPIMRHSSIPTEQLAGAPFAVQGWDLTLPAGTDVLRGDRLTLGDLAGLPTSATSARRIFTIGPVHGPKSDELSRRAVAEEVEA